jgi:hypothetical protein
MIKWWIEFKSTTGNYIQHMFLVAAIIKLSIWFWTATQIVMLTYLGMTLPLTTFPCRLMFLIGVLIHTGITIHYLIASYKGRTHY